LANTRRQWTRSEKICREPKDLSMTFFGWRCRVKCGKFSVTRGARVFWARLWTWFGFGLVLVSVLVLDFWICMRTNCAQHLACKMRSCLTRLSKSSNYMLAESCWGKPQTFSFTLSSRGFLSLSVASHVQPNEIERRWSSAAGLRPF